jgi:chromate transport protein ChrA
VTLAEMRSATDLQNICAGISLFALALGFSLFGYRLATNSLYDSIAMNGSVESSVCVAGSVASFGTGLIFLVAALIYWRYYATNRRTYSKKKNNTIIP